MSASNDAHWNGYAEALADIEEMVRDRHADSYREFLDLLDELRADRGVAEWSDIDGGVNYG